MTNMAPVATATVNGVVATSAMTSHQIFNMHLQAQGGVPVDFKAGARSGPPLHVHADHTGGGLVDVQAATAKAPPTPQQLEAANKPMPPQGNPSATRQAEFDAEMQAAGIQTRPDGRRIAVGESQHTPQAWAEGHKSVVNEHGMIPIDRINKAGLSGYVLPKVIADQHYSPEIFALLADARAEGLTQKMVDGMIRAEMKRAGWVKA